MVIRCVLSNYRLSFLQVDVFGVFSGSIRCLILNKLTAVKKVNCTATEPLYVCVCVGGGDFVLYLPNENMSNYVRRYGTTPLFKKDKELL